MVSDEHLFVWETQTKLSYPHTKETIRPTETHQRSKIKHFFSLKMCQSVESNN